MARGQLLTITPMIKGAVVDTTDDIQEVLLQRQGIGQHAYGGVTCGEKLAAIERVMFTPPDSARIEVSIYADRRQNHCLAGKRFVSDTPDYPKHVIGDRVPDPYAAASAFISEHLGAIVVLSKTTLAYMYDGVDRGEPILSPIVYEPGSDTIRSAVENYCLVAFEDGKFSAPRLDIDKAAAAYRPFIEQALAKGFGSDDRTRGADYCKRRLAWLAGAYQLEAARGQQIDVAVLSSTMEWHPTGIPAPAAAVKRKGVGMGM